MSLLLPESSTDSTRTQSFLGEECNGRFTNTFWVRNSSRWSACEIYSGPCVCIAHPQQKGSKHETNFASRCASRALKVFTANTKDDDSNATSSKCRKNQNTHRPNLDTGTPKTTVLQSDAKFHQPSEYLTRHGKANVPKSRDLHESGVYHFATGPIKPKFLECSINFVQVSSHQNC